MITLIFSVFPISTCMLDELYWPPLHACMQFKILTLIFKSQLGLALKFIVILV